MDKRKLIIFAAVVIICGTIVAVRTFYKPPTVTFTPFKQKEQIIDEAQFVIKPIAHIYKDRIVLNVDMSITSYMATDILDIPFKSQVVLNIGDQVVLAEDWDVATESKYQRAGTLTFQLDRAVSLASFMLTIITFSDNEITWP